MIYGVIINGTDTLEEWNLALLDNLMVESPKQKTDIIDIPAANGQLDYSTALTGGVPVFSNRMISFSLQMVRGGEAVFHETCETMISEFLGKECRMILPINQNYYYKGVARSIERSKNYNDHRIDFTIDAEPFRYRV